MAFPEVLTTDEFPNPAEFKDGDSHNGVVKWEVEDADGAAVDLTEFTTFLKFEIRTCPEGGVVVVAATSPTITDATTGKITLDLTTADFTGLTNDFVYVVLYNDAGTGKQPIADGRVRVAPAGVA